MIVGTKPTTGIINYHGRLATTAIVVKMIHLVERDEIMLMYMCQLKDHFLDIKLQTSLNCSTSSHTFIR